MDRDDPYEVKNKVPSDIFVFLILSYYNVYSLSLDV
jgi:hypothetical protein